MSKTDILRIPDYLGHIVEAIERIYRYIDDIEEVTFLQDEKTQDAVIRNFELVWRTIHQDLPDLYDEVKSLLENKFTL